MIQKVIINQLKTTHVWGFTKGDEHNAGKFYSLLTIILSGDGLQSVYWSF